jgi:hypothetical protein
VLSQLPVRSTPILAMDLNDDGFASALPRVFGPCQGRPPKANATTLAAKLTTHHMALANTFHPHGPTFYGTTWTSQIDHIAVPTAALPRLRTAFVDHNAGDALQTIVPKTRTNASIARRDHRPLTVFIGISLSYDGPPRRSPTCCALGRCPPCCGRSFRRAARALPRCPRDPTLTGVGTFPPTPIQANATTAS